MAFDERNTNTKQNASEPRSVAFLFASLKKESNAKFDSIWGLLLDVFRTYDWESLKKEIEYFAVSNTLLQVQV